MTVLYVGDTAFVGDSATVGWTGGTQAGGALVINFAHA